MSLTAHEEIGSIREHLLFKSLAQHPQHFLDIEPSPDWKSLVYDLLAYMTVTRLQYYDVVSRLADQFNTWHANERSQNRSNPGPGEIGRGSLIGDFFRVYAEVHYDHVLRILGNFCAEHNGTETSSVAYAAPVQPRMISRGIRYPADWKQKPTLRQSASTSTETWSPAPVPTE